MKHIGITRTAEDTGVSIVEFLRTFTACKSGEENPIRRTPFRDTTCKTYTLYDMYSSENIYRLKANPQLVDYVLRLTTVSTTKIGADQPKLDAAR